MTQDLAVDVRGISKRFGKTTVISGVDMKIARGEIRGFLGPNGSGKTTFIRILCGLLTPDSGEGICLGYNIRTEAAQIKRRVGYMTQRFSFYEDLTIEENLDFIARMYGLANRTEAVKSSLEQLGLVKRRSQLAGTLSGGWKQRLALAACIIHKPELLLLDEPTAGVDPKARRDFWEEIHSLAGSGITVLISTHYMDEAERCHTLAYIAYGRLLGQGTADDIIQQTKLSVWAIRGPKLHEAGQALRKVPGVEQVSAFGNTLHIVGKDAAVLEKNLGPFCSGKYECERIAPGLEDVFIHLMSNVEDTRV
jgi:ABC-2 type transport system ATP-binding protein